MNRERIVEISNMLIEGSISIDTITEVLKEYCEEFDKSENIDIFIQALLASGVALNYFYHALSYFQNKYNVVILMNKNNQPILNY